MVKISKSISYPFERLNCIINSFLSSFTTLLMAFRPRREKTKKLISAN